MLFSKTLIMLCLPNVPNISMTVLTFTVLVSYVPSLWLKFIDYTHLIFLFD